MYPGGLLYPMIVFWGLHRGTYMSAHVLLNLLRELRKAIKCELTSHFIAFLQLV